MKIVALQTREEFTERQVAIKLCFAEKVKFEYVIDRWNITCLYENKNDIVTYSSFDKDWPKFVNRLIKLRLTHVQNMMRNGCKSRCRTYIAIKSTSL